MPAWNDGCHIGSAIELVLKQDRVQFELVVVDRSSTDDTVSIVDSFGDSRVKLIRATQNASAGACHNMVIARCKSPFLATMKPHVLLLPEAFDKMVTLCENFPDIGMAHSYFFCRTGEKIESRERFRERQEFLSQIQSDTDYRTDLLIRGSIRDGFRIYRSEALRTVGGYHEKKGILEETRLTLRVADRFDVRILPEYLYCIVEHPARKGEASNRESLSVWGQRIFHTNRFLKSSNGRFLSGKQNPLPGLFLKSFSETRSWRKTIRLVMRIRQRIRRFFRNHWRSLRNRAYYSLVPHLAWWPIDLFHSPGRRESSPKRIAYYIWRFPVLSQTFVCRELLSLVKSGLSVFIVSEGSDDLETAQEQARGLMENTLYMLPMKVNLLRQYRNFFFRRNPFAYCNLFLFVLTHNYARNKSFEVDLSLFTKAVYLAGVLKDRKIDHIHSPWANVNAFTALVASRLLGITYSVQGRAHDLHRYSYQFAYREKFDNAEFVITNTSFNKSHIETCLWRNRNGKLHTIYNGIDLSEFMPARARQSRETEMRILCVARLIEPKGLVYLLEACKILRDGGYRFRCEIIGAPEVALDMNYYLSLKRLHVTLGLQDCVHFLGAKPFSEVLKKYGDADIFVLPCVIAEDGTRDIVPNSLIEAMAMKLPVISTTISAIPEMVEDRVSGLLVPPQDSNALADAMVQLIEDEQLRATLGTNARERVEEKFDIHKNIEGFVSLFQSKT